MKKSGVKIVFISHPISGDVLENVSKILRICKKVHTKKIIPAAPYLVSLRYLNDVVIEDRKLGIDANHEFIKRGCIDELWAYGDTISKGMRGEIAVAMKMNIPVIAKSAALKKDMEILIRESQ